MCQRHGSNQNSHPPVLVRKPLCNQFIHYHNDDDNDDGNGNGNDDNTNNKNNNLNTNGDYGNLVKHVTTSCDTFHPYYIWNFIMTKIQ